MARIPCRVAWLLLALAAWLPQARAQETIHDSALREYRLAEAEFFRHRWERGEALPPDEISQAAEFRFRCGAAIRADLLPREVRLDYLILLHHLDRHLAWGRLTDSGRHKPTATENHDHRLRWEFGVDLSSAELLDLGTAAYEETARAMEALARSVDPALDRHAYDERMKQDHPAEDGLLEQARAAMARALRFAQEEKFVTIPAIVLPVEARPGHPDARTPFGFYSPPGQHNHPRGYYVVIPVSQKLDEPTRLQVLRGNNRPWTQVVALHEAVPGHHLQLTIAAANSTRLKGTVYNSAFVEGWAFYCEHLMARHGYFTTPMERFAQLKMRLWRTARVIIDVGVHCAGLTRAEGIRILVEGVGHEPHCAELEVDRYIESPLYYSGYFVGYREIERLRKDCERAWGDRFSELRFHDDLLQLGHLPFDVIREALLGD